MEELFATFGIDWKLLLAQVVNFGVLLGVLWYFLYRPVMAMVEKRRRIIEEGVQKSEEADARLSKAHEEEREIVSKASQEAERIVADARTRAEEKGSEVLQSANERAENMVHDAAARAEETQRRALKESEREIARAAVLAAERVLRERTHGGNRV